MGNPKLCKLRIGEFSFVFLAFSLGKYVPFTQCEFFGPGAGASFLITHKGARAPASKRPEPGEPD